MAASDPGVAIDRLDANAGIVPASFVSSDELTAAEQRILAMLRADLGRAERRARLVGQGAADATHESLAEQIAALRADMLTVASGLADVNNRSLKLEGRQASTDAALLGLNEQFINSGGGGR
jgi:hypothetical protein